MNDPTYENYRVLVVDDDPHIRETYRQILTPPAPATAGLEAMISGKVAATSGAVIFALSAASQGEEAAAVHQAALAGGQPFQLAFIDMRMPPGWDGMRTAATLRAQDPSIFLVIATAFADYDVELLQTTLGHDVVLLRKPFTRDEVFQLARTLCQGWVTRRRLEALSAELENRVLARTAELDRRLAQQQILSEIATRFVELGADDDPDDAVQWTLARLGRVTGADSVFLSQETGDGALEMTHEWVALGMGSLRPVFQGLTKAALRPILSRFRRGETFSFMRLDDLPADLPDLRQPFEGRFEAGLVVAVELAGRPVGVIGIGFIHPGMHWSAYEQQLLRTSGHMLFRALEAHKTARALRQSRDLLQATGQAAQIGNWTMDVHTMRTEWDAEVSRIFGFGADAEAGMGVLAEHVHPADWPGLESSLMATVDQGTPHHKEYRIRRPDGEERWVDCWARPHREADGTVTRLVGMAQDVTERHLRKERLKLLHQAVEQSPASVLITDVHGSIEYVNRRFTEVTGYASREAIGKNPRILKSGNTPVSTYRELWDTILAGGIWTGQLENRRKDGSLYWEEAIIQGIEDDQGRVTHFVAVKEDITDRVQNHAALSAAHEWTRNILQTVETIIVALDPQGRVTLINRKGCELLGYAEEELIGRDWFEHCLPNGEVARKNREMFCMVLSEDLAGMEYQENPVRTRTGEERLIAWHNSVIRDAQGDVVGGLSAGEDVTERRRGEAALRESEALFHTMADWTHDWEYLVDPNGDFLYMTPAAERVTGHGVAEFEADPGLVDAIVHPDDRSMWMGHCRTHLFYEGRDEVCELDLRLVRKDGSLIWVTHTCRPILGPGGEYRGRRVSNRDISVRQQAAQEVHQLAHFDLLTGLPNRRLLMDRLDQALIASTRSQAYGALLYLDLDHFKSLNDSEGHDMGDRLLEEVARRLKACVREVDTVSRLGGDEFVVMVENLDLEEAPAAAQAEAIAEKLRATLGKPYALKHEDSDYHSTPSIGVTLFLGQGQAVEELLRQADLALYQAKDAGRNSVRFFSPAMQAAIIQSNAMEADLRRAMQNGELKLFYQAQCRHDGTLIGAECLLRWLPPGRDPILPAQFIPLAEVNGLSIPIGDWVLRTACRQLKDWEQDPHTQPLHLSVNVSARQFRQPDFVEQVLKILDETGIDPALLTLELTESMILDNLAAIAPRMDRLRGLGIGFSIDNFGTGCSSLAHLKRLPLDQLKIDLSFVRDITQDPNDAAIVRAILALGQCLGLQVVAEGVETEEQRTFLDRNGCSAFQGHLFGRPIPIEEWNTLQ
jgi:diguanylate cyclase (GGDEF)-like protein/PAS domain S-box-containing protein